MAFNFGNIFAGVALAGEALAAVPAFQAALKDGVLTEEELSGIVTPLVVTIGQLTKHSLPEALVAKIESAVAEAVSDFYHPKPSN